MFMPGVRRILPSSAQSAVDAPPEEANGQYTIGNNNRWSRAILNFQGLTEDTWCELGFQIGWHPDEKSRNVHDFAAIGIDFLTEDGSSVDFAYVPGLTRSQIDPHCCHIAGPGYLQRNGDHAYSGQIRCAFLIPSPAKQILVSIRSWRNSHPFTVSHAALRQFDVSSSNAGGEEQDPASSEAGSLAKPRVRHHWRTLTSEPDWFKYAVVPDRRLFIRGQVINKSMDRDGALVRVIFRNAKGEELPLPYPETLLAPGIGAFINVPSHNQTRRFTLELVPPAPAATVDLGFQAWRDEAPIELMMPLEVSLEDNLLLENISGEDMPDALTFLNRLVERLGPSLPSEANVQALDQLLDRKALGSLLTVHDRLKFVQDGEKGEVVPDQLSLGGFPTWSLPNEPAWTEDPFQSPAWRLEFQSLSWLPAVAEDSKSGGLPRAIDLALSWSQSNPWGSPADILSAHPRSMAVRAEVLLQLLSLSAKKNSKQPPGRLLALFAEAVRHGFALAQIISQNIFSHSIHQLHAACALLALAKALPRVPLAHYWVSLALAHLRHGMDELIGLDGSSIEQSQHYRLELTSFGLILATLLQEMPEAHDFRQDLLARMKEWIRSAIALIDPTGMLPPFGDRRLGYHHASWLRRLMAEYGQPLMSDERITTELSYPQGPRTLILPEAGVIAARHYERKPDWGYFCTSFNEQQHEHGHFDCASFVYAAGGLRWITDPGGSGLSDIGAARHYLISSRAHNVAIPDGREQMAGEGWMRSRLGLVKANVFEIGTNVYGPDYLHRRIVVCLDDLRAMAVFDRFTTTQRTVAFEGFLHFEPEVTVAVVNPKLVVGFQEKSRLRIIPRTVSGIFGGVAIENGRSDRSPSLQGFVSRRPGALDPANVLSYTISGQHTVCGGVILAIDDPSLKAIYDILDIPVVKNLIDEAPV